MQTGRNNPALRGDEFVTVSIYDQVYHLRGENPDYIERLAGLVDRRMGAVAAHGSTVDSLRVAVLAALNIADELAMANARLVALEGADEGRRTRAHSLAGLLDEVLLNDLHEADMHEDEHVLEHVG